MIEIKFKGNTSDGHVLEGYLIRQKGSPFVYIQNEEMGNTPVLQDSIEMLIGGQWIPISELERMKAHTFEQDPHLISDKEVNRAIEMQEFVASFIEHCGKEHGIEIPNEAYESFLDA